MHSLTPSVVTSILFALSAPAFAGEHPLRAEGNAAKLLVEDGWAAADALAAVVTYTGVEVDADGNETRRAGADLPDVEGESFDEEPETSDPHLLPLMDEAVERYVLGPWYSETPVKVSLTVWSPEVNAAPTFALTWALANLESARGEAPSKLAVRRRVADAKQAVLAPLMLTVREATLALGGRVLEEAPLSGGLTVEVTTAALAELVLLPEVVAAALESESVSDSYSWTTPGWSVGGELTGEELEEIIQSRQYYRHVDGPFTAIGQGVGVTESDGDTIFLGHLAWDDASSNSRVSNCTWIAGACAANTPTSGDPHVTAVASILVGDVTQDQDATVTGAAAQRERSGVARGATLVGKNSAVRGTVETWATSVFQGDLINQSAHHLKNCTGNTDWARTANIVYEDGVAWFNSMGNEGHSSTTTCNAAGEAAALGVFAVSAERYDTGASTANIHSTNSRGGVGSSSANGRSRAIVGMSAPTLFIHPYAFTASMVDCSSNPLVYGLDWPGTPDCGPEGFSFTSASTPVVAGAAALFRDHFLNVYNTYIEDPGVLYTNLLLMGDRHQEDGPPNYADDFDNLRGAGRLRLRTFDAIGLDNPAGWSTGDVCVDSDTTVTLPASASPFDGQTLYADVNNIRVVSWWYDRRVDDGIFSHDHDNVDLRVVRTDSSGGQTYNSTLDDNRQRISVDSNVGSSSFQIKFIGRDVTSDNEGCGTNSMKVYWAWKYEDDDSDDTDTDLDGVEVLDYIRNDP